MFEEWTRGGASGRLPALLQRHIGAGEAGDGEAISGARGAELLQRLRTDADAAAAELLAQALLGVQNPGPVCELQLEVQLCACACCVRLLGCMAACRGAAKHTGDSSCRFRQAYIKG